MSSRRFRPASRRESSDSRYWRAASRPALAAFIAIGVALLACALILAVGTAPLAAQDTIEEPDIDFTDQYVGWAVGASDSGYGAIFRSTDGGDTWARQGSPETIPDTALQAVAAIDPLTCWVVGEVADGYGTILRTEDGGATWTRQGSPETISGAGLAKISAVDRDTAWVVGTPGTVLFTDDGGATWTQKQTADIPPVLLQGVYALDRDNVWVTGDMYEGYGTIFRTEDGGASWHRKGSAADVPDAALLDVHASDADTAWIASRGNPSTPTPSVIHTDDNGASWTGQTLVAFFDTNSLTTVGDDVVWVVTDADGIFRTDNAKDFVRQDSVHGKYSYYLVCIQALDANTAWAAGPASAGAGVAAGIVEHTSDGGKTWVNQLEIDVGLQAVSFVRPSTFYFAEGTTYHGFDTYFCIANPGQTQAEVVITYMLADGTTSKQTLSVPEGSRATVCADYYLGLAGGLYEDFGAVVTCTNGQVITAERPMYSVYWGPVPHMQPPGSTYPWTGGSCVVGAASLANDWYFAEGYTGPGFEEYVCVLNPGDEAADLTFRFHIQGEVERTAGGLSVPPHARATFRVNDLLGTGYETSLVLESTRPVVAERSMYFDYAGTGTPRHWTGGHCVAGAASLASRYCFAEGCTRDGFDEYLVIHNPGSAPISVDAVYRFGPGQGDAVERSYDVEAGARRTVFVADEVGEGKDVSAELTSTAPFLAERPMYFDYAGSGAPGWSGGHCVIGATRLAREWLFAEGCTEEGFQEWLCLYNPGDADAVVRIDYLIQEEGSLPPEPATVTVPERARVNVFVNESAGPGNQLACRLQVTSGPAIVAERPMYFSYGPAGWTGGHCVVGLPR